MTDPEYQRSALLAGSIAGGLAVCVYVAWSVLPMPDPINRLFHFAFGPLLVCAFMGIYFFLCSGKPRFLHLLAAGFGIVAGTVFTMMTVVQQSMVDRVLLPLRQASDPAMKTHLKYVLQGTNSVQLGLDIVWDIFITVATILVGMSLLREGGAIRFFGLLGMVIGAITLALNLWTFPMPPAQAGLFDLGPWVGAWFGGVCILMARQYRLLAPKPLPAL